MTRAITLDWLTVFDLKDRPVGTHVRVARFATAFERVAEDKVPQFWPAGSPCWVGRQPGFGKHKPLFVTTEWLVNRGVLWVAEPIAPRMFDNWSGRSYGTRYKVVLDARKDGRPVGHNKAFP
jgi:hypothetical protein